MTTEKVGLYDDMNGMYLSGASIRSIVKAYGSTLTGSIIISTIEAIESGLTNEDVKVRKLNKAKIKLGRLQGKYNTLYSKELKHDERARHFKTKKLIIEQSITKLHACIDKLNAV